MKKLLIICLIIVGNSISCYSQNDNGAIFAQFNTVLVYSNYTFNYESKSLFASIEKHNFRLTGGIGGWSSSAFNKNRGLILNYGLNYQFGNKSHLLEVDIIAQNHFDKGLKEQGITFIATTLRPFFGYRYQPEESHFFLKIGTGWREVFQIGFGYKF